jgi:hypothetical protein
MSLQSLEANAEMELWNPGRIAIVEVKLAVPVILVAIQRLANLRQIQFAIPAMKTAVHPPANLLGMAQYAVLALVFVILRRCAMGAPLLAQLILLLRMVCYTTTFPNDPY